MRHAVFCMAESVSGDHESIITIAVCPRLSDAPCAPVRNMSSVLN